MANATLTKHRESAEPYRSTTQQPYSPSQLFGRDVESQLILEAYQRSMKCIGDDKSSSNIAHPLQELVLIQGLSGTGKTTLARTIESEVIDNDLGFFLCGKFEPGQGKKPYEVLVSSFERLLEAVNANKCSDLDKDDRYNKICEVLCEEIGTEGKVLTNMIPALESLIGPQQEKCDVGGKEALQRFQFAFSKLIRAVSSVAPIVLFLDDLQWSDPASSSLLQMVLESAQPPNKSSRLLVICAFRDGETKMENHRSSGTSVAMESIPQNSLNHFLKCVSSSTLISSTLISLQNLEVETLCRLVAAKLNVSTEISIKLGSIMYAKCQGNPFHALQLMDLLIHHKALQQDSNVRQWTWDETDVYQITDAADAVDEMIAQKLSLLPLMVQNVVMAAACMGTCIDHPALCTVFDGDVSGIEGSLQTLQAQGFLILTAAEGQYRFTHDRVHQAAISLIEDVDALSFEIGHKLWTKATPMLLNTKMFLIVNLLNHGTKLMKDQSERYLAARVNLEAGLEAVSLTSFQDGALFLRAGIEFLEGGDYWNDQYDLSLRLFNAAADAELCNQNNSDRRVDELVRVILENARSLKDKLHAYVVKINYLGQRGSVVAATKVGIEVMAQLGEPLPKKVTHVSILVEIVKTRMALRGRDNTALLTLPPMQKEDKIAAIYVLTNLVSYSFQASSNYIVVIGARLVRLSLKYGMHKCCAHGFVAFAFILCALDRKEGYRLGKHALTLVERYRAKELLPRVHFTFYGLVHHWMRPLEESLDPLDNAYRVGMETGDVEYALMNLSFYLGHYLKLGKPLSQIEDQVNEAIKRMKLFRHDHLLEMQLIFTQFVHNITGRAPIAKVLAGDVSPLYDDSRQVDSLLIPYLNYSQGAELAFLFGDLHLASQLLEKKRSLGFDPTSFYYISKIAYTEALICVGLARTCLPNKQRAQHVKRAKAALAQMKAWAKNCPQNFQHKQYLMEAELKSLGIPALAMLSTTKRKHHAVQTMYDRAIERARNAGFVEEAAVANELAGDFMERHNDHASARRYWEEALALVTQWGATEKAKHIQTSRIDRSPSH